MGKRHFHKIRQPLGGFKSKYAAARFYVGLGYDHKDIMDSLEMNKSQLEDAIKSKPSIKYLHIGKQAYQRGMSFDELVEAMLFHINEDEMVNAIMDDDPSQEKAFIEDYAISRS